MYLVYSNVARVRFVPSNLSRGALGHLLPNSLLPDGPVVPAMGSPAEVSYAAEWVMILRFSLLLYAAFGGRCSLAVWTSGAGSCRIRMRESFWGFA